MTDPYGWLPDAEELKAHMGVAAAIRDPRAQAKIMNLPPALQVIVNANVPEGQLFQMDGKLVMGPITMWRIMHDMRDPLVSRWSVGMREVRRERRRRGR